MGGIEEVLRTIARGLARGERQQGSHYASSTHRKRRECRGSKELWGGGGKVERQWGLGKRESTTGWSYKGWFGGDV